MINFLCLSEAAERKAIWHLENINQIPPENKSYFHSLV